MALGRKPNICTMLLLKLSCQDSRPINSQPMVHKMRRYLKEAIRCNRMAWQSHSHPTSRHSHRQEISLNSILLITQAEWERL